jgi:serine/threonine-protein kinase
MKLEPGRVIGGRYTVAERIGMGGMAVVYRALDTKLNRAVTLKVMREEHMADQEFIARFQKEAHAAASLSNACIVNVYDVGQEDSMHYIVMEYVEGMTLKELIQEKAPLSNKETASIAEQIAQALSAAHKKGIVHRDIKPQNILVTPQGVVKVTDFGIARAVDGGTITTGPETMGSVHYFSPEQARGGYVDHRSDIYSLGIVMYEMATGRLPFEGDTSVAVAMKHLSEPLPDMREINPIISEKLERIIRKAAEKSTASRYGSADELLEDLWEDSRRRKPASSSRPKDSYKLDAKDDRKVVAAAIATAFAIIALITFLGWWIIEKNKPVQVSAPNVAGLTLERASLRAEELGLVLVPDLKFDEVVEEGLVISQVEPPGAKLAQGSALHVMVSRGSNMVIMPDVINKTSEEAASILDEHGIGLSEVTEFSETVVAGHVISQEPAPGEKMDPDTVATLFVSLGPAIKTAIVPNMVEMTESEAIEALQSRGIAVGLSTRAPHDTIPSGRIISQTIKEGTVIVQGGAEVSYVISSGPASGPTATPAPQVALKNKVLKIELPMISEEITSLHLKVIKIIEGGAETILDEVVPADAFPVTVKISGAGVEEYQIYVVKDDGQPQLIADQMVNFNED